MKLMLSLLALTSIPIVTSRSLFNCVAPCYLPYSNEQTTLYTKTAPNSTTRVYVTNAPSEIHVELSFPQLYPLNAYSTSLLTQRNTTFHCVTHLQISKYTVVSGMYSTVNGSLDISVSAVSGEVIWSITVGQASMPSSRDLVIMPYIMAKTHGSAWARQYYYYIYVSVTLGVATLYITHYHPRMWKTCIAVSMSFFAATACDKIYHAVNAGCVKTSERVYIACVVIILAEIVPLIYCVLLVSKGQSQPIRWGGIGFLGAVCLLFVHGSGWFVGPCVLALGCILLMFLRVLERK